MKTKKDVPAQASPAAVPPCADDDGVDAAASADVGAQKSTEGPARKVAEGGETPAPENPDSEDANPEAAAESQAPAEGPDWKGMYARAMADFDNFRKRTARDREDLVKQAAKDVVKDVLPTVDNLALALEKAADKKDDPFVAGVKLVYDGLLKTLAGHGAEPLDAKGEPFDANFHEALATLPSEDVAEGHVVAEVKRGWLLNGKLLRAAQVVVSAGKAAK